MVRWFRGLSAAVSIAIVAALISSCTSTPASSPQATQEVLKVGVINSLSGAAASVGNAITNFQKIEADRVNAEGGFTAGGKKYRVELVIEDDQFKPDAAVTAVNKLISQDKVKILNGPMICIDCVMAMQQTVRQAKVMQWGTTGAKLLGPEAPLNFRQSMTFFERGPGLVAYLQKNYPNVKAVAMIGSDDQSGHSYGDTLKGLLTTSGMKVVSEQYFAPGTKDFNPPLQRIIASNPDYIDLLSTQGADLAMIVKQLRELGYKGLRGDQGMTDPNTIIPISGKEALEGHLSYAYSAEGDNAPQGYKDIRARYEKAYGTWNTIALVDAAFWPVLLAGIKAADSVDSEKIAKALEGIKTFDTPHGKAFFDRAKFYGIAHNLMYPVMIVKVVDGKSVVQQVVGADTLQKMLGE